MVIQVDVRGGQHFAFGVVLRLDQLLRELRAVVVVNHGQGSHHRAVFFHVLGHGVVPHQIANGFRAVLVAFLMNDAIKPLQQIAFERNTGSHQVGHESAS